MITDSKVERWLSEDLGHHDVTNQVPGETTGRLVAREDGIAAGFDAATAVFEYLDCTVEQLVAAGDRIESGDVVLEVTGPARAVLRGERVAVNIAGHASGIATKTRRAVDAARVAVARATGESEATETETQTQAKAKATKDVFKTNKAGECAGVRIAGTRKTTPGLRGIEKRAIVAGGGDTHRLDLSHMVMVKDNHIAEMGMDEAVAHFREQTSFTTKIEVEVETPEDAPRAARAGADIVLLDNMTPDETARGVDLLRAVTGDGNTRTGTDTDTDMCRTVLTEASGGITIETVPDYATTGVDIISMGSLTHSAPSLDYSFRTG